MLRTRFSPLVLAALLTGVAGCGPSAPAPAPEAEAPATVTVTERVAPISTETMRFRHLTVENGLSQNAVYAIVQDREGFVWLGTKDGLNRYDGRTFTVYRHDPFDEATLPSSFVTALLESADGHLWVGTREGGVARLDPATGEVVRYANSPRAHVLDLAEDANGDLWVGTIDAGLYRLAGRAPDASVETFRHDPADPASLGDDRIEAVLADREGRLWIGTAAGLSRREDGGFVHFEVAPAVDGGDPDPNYVSALTQSGDGTLWAATSGGLARVDDPVTGRLTRFPYPPRLSPVWEWGAIEDLSEGPDGGLWAATHTTLSRFDPETGAHTYARHDPDEPTSLTGNNLQSLLWDRSDVLWVGTNGYGASLYDAKSARFGTLGRPAGEGSGWSAFSARAIFEDRDGRVWVNANERLYVEDEPGGTLVVFEPIDGATNAIGPTNMVQDREGTMWFTSQRGLHSYDPETERTRLYRHDPDDPESLLDPHSADQIRGVFEDREGTIWVVTHHYLSRLDDPEAGRFRHLAHTPRDESRSLSATYFLSLHEDTRGRFWIATDTGVLRVDPATGESKRYRTDPGDPTSLSHDLVRAVLPDPETPDRVLWIGTGGGGLNRFDVETETFQHVTTADGLPNNVVYGVLSDDDGRLWLSTNRGLARYDPRTGSVQTYDARDGLQSNEFNTASFHRGASGTLYFGGVYGVNVFDPADFEDNPFVPNVALTGLSIGDRPVAVGDSTGLLAREPWATDELRLSHRENMVTVSFAALDFSAPQKNRYAYRMEGLDETWIQAGTNGSATYTNLPPGRYTFRVRGSNNDGVWNDHGAALAVAVAPPWWRAWWAYALYAVLLVGAVVAVVRYRDERQRLAQQAELAQAQAEALQALDRSKSEFFANVSHEFRTPLTLTLGPLDDVLAGEYGPLPDAIEQPIGLARRSADRVLALVNQILAIAQIEAGHAPLRPQRLDLGAFASVRAEAFAAFAKRCGVALVVVPPPAPVAVDADPEHIATVLDNLLSNALKFTPAGGRVLVTVAADAADARVTVEDTGPGIPPDDLPHVFDRFYQASVGTGETVGTGIGLALARDLAALHGGTLIAESAPGEGSTFALTLPLGEPRSPGPAAEHVDAETQRPRLDPSGDGAAGPLPEPVEADVTTVLVVDDHADIRAYVRHHLEAAGYGVAEAADGEAALDRVRQRLPDLVVSDVMMPRLDGLGLCRALRADPETDFIPVLLLTARAAPEDRIEGLSELCDDYLTKPFDVGEMVARVDNLIALRKRLRARFQTAEPAGDGAPDGLDPLSPDEEFASALRAVVAEQMSDEAFGVGALAEGLGLSRSSLRRRTTAALGATPSDLIRTARLERAADLLAADAGTVSEIAYGVGFKSVAHFSNAFLAHHGVRPSGYTASHGEADRPSSADDPRTERVCSAERPSP